MAWRAKDSGKGGAFTFSVTNFVTHFHELVSLYCVLLCDCGRGDGLGFAGFDFRFRWSSGRPLLCSFRKRGFQEVTYKTSFAIIGDSTPFALPLLLLLVSVSVSIRWVIGLSRLVGVASGGFSRW